MKKCGLLGKNIQYSRSPEIHNKYYTERNIPIFYKLFDMDEERIPKFIMDLSKDDIIGFNVTIPYKQTILKYLNRLVYPANKIGAVNTVAVEGKELVGYNTDFYGFIKSLESFNINLNHNDALVIGNGGAAKCIVTALQDLNCKSIEVAARDICKTKEIFNNNCKVMSINNAIDTSSFDFIVNCTPLGSANYLDILPLDLSKIKNNSIVYDLIYNPEKTAFLKKAEQLGATIINGERMLYYQAYSAADIWISNINI